MEFNNQIALVTGGSRGIGKGVAKELASQGAHVLINYVNNQTEAERTLGEIEESGGCGRIVRFDVSDFKEVQSSISELSQELGGIHILINNAGVEMAACDIGSIGEQDWDHLLDINLKGIFNCTKAVSRGMLKNRYGKIVNITSLSGEFGKKGQAGYSASKAGIIGFTKSTAKEFSARGITVNAVSPGFVDTELLTRLPVDVKKRYLDLIPVGRFGSVEEISSVVCFLVSEGASYITGEVIKVNGGFYM